MVADTQGGIVQIVILIVFLINLCRNKFRRQGAVFSRRFAQDTGCAVASALCDIILRDQEKFLRRDRGKGNL